MKRDRCHCHCENQPCNHNRYPDKWTRFQCRHCRQPEEPTHYLLDSLKKSEADEKAGRVISFKNGKEALAYLDKMIEKDKSGCKPER